MIRICKRIAAFILTVAMTMSFGPLLGNQESYALEVEERDLTLDVGSGEVRLSGIELNLVLLALEELDGFGDINAEDQRYDLDKDGSMDLAVENYVESGIGELKGFNIWKDNSCVGVKVFQLNDEQKNAIMHFTGGVTCSSLTIDFREQVKEINVNVASPVCGVETTTPESTGSGFSPWDWDNQTNRPEHSIENSSKWLKVSDSMWVKGPGVVEPYIGKFVGGTQYDVAIVIGAGEGYKYAEADDMTVKVNGVTGTNVVVMDDVLTVFGKADAIHTMDAGTVTQQPSVTSNGVKAYKCTGCGTVLKTEAVSNAAVKQAAYAPGQASLKKVKKGSKRATVTFKTMKNVSGYQIQFTSTKDGSVKNATVKQTKKVAKKKTANKVVKGLAKKTNYTVQVRAYRAVKGETFYGPWSNAKSVKIK